MTILKDLLIGVTGISGHLGSQLARDLLSQGALVAGCGRTTERLEQLRGELVQNPPSGVTAQGIGERLFLKQCDVRDGAALSSFINATEAHFGRPFNGWVNNANSGKAEQLGSLTSDGLTESFEGGLHGMMLATQLIADHFSRHSTQGASATGSSVNHKDSAKGSIVNISSMYGVVSPQPDAYIQHPQFHNPPAYGAIKAGVLQFTRYAAVHYARRGIRVNTVSPGPFPSPKVQKEAMFIQELERRVPLGRIGSAHEFTGPVIFLLSPLASYVTGAEVRVDGGWTAW